MFIIPHFPKTQEEEYKVYPWASSLRFSAHKRANAPDFYLVPCRHQTTSTSSLPACRHPSLSRTNKTSCPSPCHGSTFRYPCCLSASRGCLYSWSTLYSCATYNSTPYRNWCLFAVCKVSVERYCNLHTSVSYFNFSIVGYGFNDETLFHPLSGAL